MYNSLQKKAQSDYFASLFDNSKSLWHSLDKILHRSNLSQQISLSIHSAGQFSSFFSDKINTFCLNLSLIKVNPYSAPNKLPPTFSSFKSASFDEIKQLLLLSPKFNCQSDPILSSLLPNCIDNIFPTITSFANLSIDTGSFPNQLKSAFVKPLKKKQILIKMI